MRANDWFISFTDYKSFLIDDATWPNNSWVFSLTKIDVATYPVYFSLNFEEFIKNAHSYYPKSTSYPININ